MRHSRGIRRDNAQETPRRACSRAIERLGERVGGGEGEGGVEDEAAPGGPAAAAPHARRCNLRGPRRSSSSPRMAGANLPRVHLAVAGSTLRNVVPSGSSSSPPGSSRAMGPRRQRRAHHAQPIQQRPPAVGAAVGRRRRPPAFARRKAVPVEPSWDITLRLRSVEQVVATEAARAAEGLALIAREVGHREAELSDREVVLAQRRAIAMMNAALRSRTRRASRPPRPARCATPRPRAATTAPR